VAIWPITTLL